jgi:hypothetical protein
MDIVAIVVCGITLPVSSLLSRILFYLNGQLRVSPKIIVSAAPMIFIRASVELQSHLSNG